MALRGPRRPYVALSPYDSVPHHVASWPCMALRGPVGTSTCPNLSNARLLTSSKRHRVSVVPFSVTQVPSCADSRDVAEHPRSCRSYSRAVGRLGSSLSLPFSPHARWRVVQSTFPRRSIRDTWSRERRRAGSGQGLPGGATARGRHPKRVTSCKSWFNTVSRTREDVTMRWRASSVALDQTTGARYFTHSQLTVTQRIRPCWSAPQVPWES